jgi:hypothetical protein
MNDNKSFPKDSVPVVDKNFHGTENHKAKGVSSKAMKQFGRNIARAKNQRGQ